MSKKKADKDQPKSAPKRGSRLSSFLASEMVKKLKKKHGEMALIRASDFKVQDVPRIPTGVFDLDYALGGGFPAGRISTLYGPKSSGKTTIFLKTIANAQQMCSDCFTFIDEEKGRCVCGECREFVIAFLDVEGALDIPWARKMGVDTEQMMIDIPEYAEAALDIGEALLRSGEVDILVLDSLAFLTPAKEIEVSVEKDLMGTQPRLIGKGVRKFLSAINGVGKESGRRPTVFFTNQIRYKLGVMFGDPETQPGGMAPGFVASIEARLAPGKYEIDDTTKKPLWVDMRFKVNKNKVFGAKMAGEYRLLLSDTDTRAQGDVADELSMVTWGEKFGIVTRKGGYNCLDRSFRIKQDLIDALTTEPKFKQELRDILLPIMLVA
jgi:recombination protein RecA